MARDAARHAVECNPHFSGLQAILIAALVRLGRSEEAQAAAKRLLALDPTFSVRNLAVIVGAVPAVFAPFAEAWIEAGLPKE
jgi:Flp pilus assembly protein TadD